MIGMFVGLLVVEQMVRPDHIVDHVGFADLLRSELLWGAEILSVVVS